MGMKWERKIKNKTTIQTTKPHQMAWEKRRKVEFGREVEKESKTKQNP